MNRVRGVPVLAPAVLSLLLAAPAFAQGVGINGTGAAADTSAILDLTSTSKGFLPPRMTQANRLAIVLPANGLVVYQTDGQAGLYYNVGTPLSPSWKLVADASSLSSSPWTVSGPNIYYTGGKVGIDRTSPVAPLDILGGNWDVVNGEGDIRIGDAATRLKIGLALGGGGTGAATIMEQGPVGAYNTLSLGTQGNKVLHVNGATQRVGIGTDAPSAPLGFPATLGKKITLYPGATGDAGLGMAGNRLQIYADNAAADIALGYETGGIFQEHFAFKQNGALAVNGSTGNPGQVLQSNGANAATWVTPPTDFLNWYQNLMTSQVTITSSSNDTPLPGLTQALNVSGGAWVIVTVNLSVSNPSCFACGSSRARMHIRVDGNIIHRYLLDIPNGESLMFTPTYLTSMGPGAHTVTIYAEAAAGPDQLWGFPSDFASSLLLHVVPF